MNQQGSEDQMRLSGDFSTLLNHVKKNAAATYSTFSRKQTNGMRKTWQNLHSMKFVSLAWTRGHRDTNGNLPKQFPTPSLIQSRVVSAVCYLTPPPVLTRCSAQTVASVTVFTYEARLKCPPRRGATWDSNVLLWILSLPCWRDPDSEGGPIQTCLQVSCVRQDVGLWISGCKLQPVAPQSIIRALSTRTKGLRRGRRQEERKEGVYGSVSLWSAKVCVVLLQ